MLKSGLSVREMNINDCDLIINYWLSASNDFLISMGVEKLKLPSKEQFHAFLQKQIVTSLSKRESYVIIWEENETPIGHSNTRPTNFGKDAFMHLHIWKKENRSKGYGFDLLRLTIPLYFNNLKLQHLYCEPYALNAAPNKTLSKLGFLLVEEKLNTPGVFNFEQPTKRWALSKERFLELY